MPFFVPSDAEDGRVARVEPPVTHDLLGRLRVVVIALHDHVAARHDLAQRVAVSRNALALFVDDAQLARRDQLDARERLDDPELVGSKLLVLRSGLADGDEWSSLGETAHLCHLPPEITFHAL